MNAAGDVGAAFLEAVCAAGLDTVEGAFAYDGGHDLTPPGMGHRERRAARVVDARGEEHVLYVKRYGPEPLRMRLRRWLRHGWGASPAGVEIANIRRLRAAGMPTIARAVGGQEPNGLGAGRSYVVLEAVPGEALEQCGGPFVAAHGLRSARVAAFTQALASLVRRLHRAGFVHRDLYASHIFMHESNGGVALWLIDLARAFAPRWRRFRWRVKDLAQLKYSMPPDWVAEHWDDLLAAYLGAEAADRRRRYERAIDRKVAAIARHDRRRPRRLPQPTGAA